MNDKILIVEDSAINRNILAKFLMTEYDILQAENGKEALEIISEKYEEISAIILDLQMPVMSGKELLEIMSKEAKYGNLPILIATGQHDDALESECLQLGAWDFVTKPYNPIVIKLRLQNIIARSQTKLMKQIQELAERDTLTGVYNRGHFMRVTKELLLANQREFFVLIRMDIDHFRLYNSSFGSKAGDILLQKIAEGIEQTLEKHKIEKGTFGRIESDVFCICVPYHKEKLEEELKKIEIEIQRFCATYRLKATFGLYVVEDHDADMEKMYAYAVEAARSCKNNLNASFAYYDSQMSKKEEMAQILTNEMAVALAEHHFQVYLQPKFSLDTESPCGAEALVRWIHPEWGMVSPGEFIPVFEQNGLIVQLDYYMWENVCILLKKWIDEGRDVLPVSVNISRISMYNPKIVDQLVGLIKKYKIPAYLLNLEVTESAYMSSPDMMKNIITELRNHGFIILMDDFGSGYSSLNTLKDIDVDILKIDMKFLPTGHNNTKSEKILASIVRMAGWLGMPVIVEGVETKEQKDFLESIGAGYVQGYYYARPMPVQDYLALLDEHKTIKEKNGETDLSALNEFDVLWASDSKTSALLKSVTFPFAIFEYSNSQIDILRSNQMFTQAFERKSFESCLLPKEKFKLLSACDNVIFSHGMDECECLFIMLDGATKWYHIRLAHIGTAGTTNLISASFIDVTSENSLQNELNQIFAVLKPEDKKKDSLLIIDDQEVGREILSNLFEDEYQILQAADGQEGLALLEKNEDNIAAILLDMIMPKMDGSEFLSYKNRIKGAADIPVIIISAEDNEDVQINLLKSGVNDYITKPFVAAVVKKRLKNVIEYNSRFRKMLQEYHQANAFADLKDGSINLSGYNIYAIKDVITFMSNIFDLVRLVDPKETAVVSILEDGTVEKLPYSCFSIWGKEVRCENCTSQCAMNGQCALSKFELLKNDVFYVVSQPVVVDLGNGKNESLVLEIASKISEEYQDKEEDVNTVYGFLEETHNMIYKDPLTSAYNRRFLNEMLFMHHGQNEVAHKISFIMMDLYRFKQINDLFGHLEGDKVLREVVEALKSQVRESDSVIRYGGDEFMIILTGCDEAQTEEAIERFKAAVRTVHYGAKDAIAAEADFGYAFTERFDGNEETLENLIHEADVAMYENKKNHVK